MAQVLRQLPTYDHPEVLVGSAAGDDAGVIRLDDTRALVQTVDFFTPIVDDGHTYGRIAATNALSDVYAMGGRPLSALNILGYPEREVPEQVVVAILRGGAEAIEAAGCALIGGHTVRNPEPIYGAAVTGLVDPARMIVKQAGRPGDLLVLTKPLGTGIVATALKRDLAPPAAVERAVALMTTRNDAGPPLAAAGVRAGTDVTGFGLTGHVASLCAASGCAAELWWQRIPALDPAVPELIRAGCVPGGSADNLAAADTVTDWGDCPGEQRTLMADAQTSGGLLVCVAEPLLAAVQQLLAQHESEAHVIGRLISDAPHQLTVRAAP